LGEHGYRISSRNATHGKLFGVGSTRFLVNCHNRGNKQVKPYSVGDFANAMIECKRLSNPTLSQRHRQ